MSNTICISFTQAAYMKKAPNNQSPFESNTDKWWNILFSISVSMAVKKDFSTNYIYVVKIT